MKQKKEAYVLIIITTIIASAGCATVSSNRAAKIEPKVRVQQLEEELKQKDAEIAALKDEIAQSDSNYPSTYLSTNRNFSNQNGNRPLSSSLGSVSMKSIQKALKNSGFYSGSIDGQAGVKTRDAIKAFQKARGLKADGVVGKKTWSALSSYLN